MLEYCDDYNNFIRSIVKKVKTEPMFSGINLSDDDLYQRGWLELIKAYYDYDANNGAKLTTYAFKRILFGVKEEAISQINNGMSVRQIKNLEFIILDDAEFDISDESSVDFNDDSDDISKEIRQLLTNEEYKILCVTFGIDCEQCSDPKKLAKRFGMSVLEVKKAVENGKRKLRVLYGRE